MSDAPPDISVVLTAHGEGRLAHRSVRSSQRAIAFARKQGISVELLAVLDAPSPATLEYFTSQRDLLTAITEVGFRDLGRSRNHGVARARGRHVAFLDADDLFSENWLAAAWQFAAAQRQDKLILHPELNLYFGAGLAVFRHMDTTAPDYSPLNFIRFNHWTALSFVARDFFLDGNQYAPIDLKTGFGYEDWHWNCETIARGAIHRVVPRTVHFLRQKPQGSLARSTSQANATFRPTSLFAEGSPVLCGPTEPALLPLGESPRSPHGLTRRFRSRLGLPVMRLLSRIMDFDHHALTRQICEQLLLPGKTVFPPAVPVPQWLLDEWRGIHRIDPELFPDESLVAHLQWQSYPDASAVRCYPMLHAQIGPDPTHVFLVARRDGGRDGRDLDSFSRALSAQGHRVAWIMTEAPDRSWTQGPPSGIRLVQLGQLLPPHAEDEKVHLLLRLLMQKQPRAIHNMDSSLGHVLFARHGPCLSSQSRLYVSLYDRACSPEGRLCGPAFTHLPSYLDSLSGALVDEPALIDTLCTTYAFERHKFLGPSDGTLSYRWQCDPAQGTHAILPPMNTPAVSVVMPVYNGEDSLDQAFDQRPPPRRSACMSTAPPASPSFACARSRL